MRNKRDLQPREVALEGMTFAELLGELAIAKQIPSTGHSLIAEASDVPNDTPRQARLRRAFIERGPAGFIIVPSAEASPIPRRA